MPSPIVYTPKNLRAAATEARGGGARKDAMQSDEMRCDAMRCRACARGDGGIVRETPEADVIDIRPVTPILCAMSKSFFTMLLSIARASSVRYGTGATLGVEREACATNNADGDSSDVD